MSTATVSAGLVTVEARLFRRLPGIRILAVGVTPADDNWLRVEAIDTYGSDWSALRSRVEIRFVDVDGADLVGPALAQALVLFRAGLLTGAILEAIDKANGLRA